MLSRVADSLYWMSRYLERAENTTRQLDVTMSLMLDTGGTNVETRWTRLLASIGKPAGLEWGGGLEHMARALVFDGFNPASVTFCINGARENARQVREEISSEQWQRLNRAISRRRNLPGVHHPVPRGFLGRNAYRATQLAPLLDPSLWAGSQWYYGS